MKYYRVLFFIYVVVVIFLCLWGTTLLANEEYNAGSVYAQSVKGQGTAAISGMNPAEAIPSFNGNPPEASRYGGVTDTSNNMDNDGNKAFQESEAGKAITESILNNPKEPISVDAPFISAGFDAQDNAEAVTDGGFDGCESTKKDQTIISSHVCERDINVTQTCKRSAYVITTGSTEHVRMQVVMNAGSVAGRRIENYWIQYDFVVTEDGTLGVTGGTWEFLYPSNPGYHGDRLDYSIEAFGQTIRTKPNYSGVFSISPQNVTRGQVISLKVRFNTDGHYDEATNGFLSNIANGRFVTRVTLPMDAVRNTRVPVINWSEPCALSQEHGVSLVESVCSAPGGYRDVIVDGVSYHVYSDCWVYTDTYRTQGADEGTCGALAADPACTLATHACAFSDNGLCLHENVTYTCETKVTSEGMLCGGQFFCTDGTCAQTEAGKSDSLQQAISQLAAVSAAGEDVAKLNDVNVKAFTGLDQSCRKATAGFNNCCASGGWGGDVGLAHCSSEEKALGEARERKLTVEVGEYCSRRVLGVCLQKKRAFCVFESKLAQIVQQQGRQWQLGIGFGSADGPDCRGITIDELQRIDFSRLDFKNFYADLENAADIPSDNDLIERAKELIKHRMEGVAK